MSAGRPAESGDNAEDVTPPRRPGEDRLVTWLRVGGVLAMGLSVPAAWVLLDVLPDLFAPSNFAPSKHLFWLVYGSRAVTWSATLAFVVGAALASAPRQIIARPALAAFLASLIIAFAMLGYHATWLRLEPRKWDGDAALYYRMAREWPWRPGGWFRYRIVAPWLVRGLADHPEIQPKFDFYPASDLGYWRLALLSLTLTGPALSLLLRDLRFGAAARHLGVLLYLCSFAFLYNSWNYAMPDPLAMLLLVLACRAIVRGRDAELVVWLLVGALTKEVVLFLVPVRWLWARRRGLDLPQALRAGLVAAPALAVFAWMRFGSGSEAAEYTGFVTGNAWLFPWKHQPGNVARLFSPFAAGWVLILLSLRRPDRWTIAAAGFAVPCVLSLLVTDAGRMLVYLLPFAIPAMLRAAGAGGPGRADDADRADDSGRPIPRRGLIALLLVCLSSRLWEPFVPLWRVPIEIRRPLALGLALVCGWLVYRIVPRSPDTTESSTDASSPASAA